MIPVWATGEVGRAQGAHNKGRNQRAVSKPKSLQILQFQLRRCQSVGKARGQEGTGMSRHGYRIQRHEPVGHE